MTERQFEVYSFIVQYTKEHLYPPSVSEIAQGTGLKSKSAVFDHLVHIADLGYIKLTPGVSRGITLVGFEIKKTS